MFRCTPISLYLCGKPKIGKSHILIKIVKEINNRLYKKKDLFSVVFTKTVTTEHWDGYFGQKIVIFDDHYKKQDGEQSLDAREVMNTVSCTNYYPSFAHLNSKGTPLNIDFLIITSNVGYPITEFIPSALHRRHKHHVICIQYKKTLSHDFSHLKFFHALEIIDPWAGNYSHPYSQLKDIPYSMEEFETFPYKHLYTEISLEALLNNLVQDYQFETGIFNKMMQQ